MRTRYRFRLQTVLDLRIEQLNKIQQRAAEEEHHRAQILQRIAEHDSIITQAFEEQKNILSAHSPDFSSIQQFPNYVFRLKQSRYQEQHALQMQEARLVSIREELKQAMIRKKSLETLKEQGQKAHRQLLEKAEDEFLAELTLMRGNYGSASKTR